MSVANVPIVSGGPTHLDLPDSDSLIKLPDAQRRGASEYWPSHLDLPDSDGKPVENTFEHPQAALLSDLLDPVLKRLHPDGNYFVGSNSGIYWYYTQPDPNDGCKSPDWYYVPNVPPLVDGKPRRSYVHYKEKANPLVVMEFVSGDGRDERNDEPVVGKRWVYAHAIAAPFYVIWDTPRGELEVYELIRGNYQQLPADEHGRVYVKDLGVSFGVWRGEYLNYTLDWLRCWDRDGNMLPTGAERTAAAQAQVEAERKRAEAEKSRADVQQQRAQQLAARLRELGVDPDSV